MGYCICFWSKSFYFTYYYQYPLAILTLFIKWKSCIGVILSLFIVKKNRNINHCRIYLLKRNLRQTFQDICNVCGVLLIICHVFRKGEGDLRSNLALIHFCWSRGNLFLQLIGFWSNFCIPFRSMSKVLLPLHCCCHLFRYCWNTPCRLALGYWALLALDLVLRWVVIIFQLSWEAQLEVLSCSFWADVLILLLTAWEICLGDTLFEELASYGPFNGAIWSQESMGLGVEVSLT